MAWRGETREGRLRDLLFRASNRIILWASARGLGRNGWLGRAPLAALVWSRVDRFLFARLHPRTAKVQGHIMVLDARDSLWLSRNGVHEPFETARCLEAIGEGDVVLDIGANIGYHTLLFARRVGEEGRVHAFEPDPTNFALLRQNVEINGYRNVVLHRRAVASGTGRLRLYLDDLNRGGHRTSAGEGRPSVEVEAVRIDDLLEAGLGRVHFIKMDIEGAELAALAGMVRLLACQPAVAMMVEFWPRAIRLAGREPQELPELLLRLGFTILILDAKARRVLPWTGEALAALDRPGTGAINLLCTRGAPERHAAAGSVGDGAGESASERAGERARDP